MPPGFMAMGSKQQLNEMVGCRSLLGTLAWNMGGVPICSVWSWEFVQEPASQIDHFEACYAPRPWNRRTGRRVDGL